MDTLTMISVVRNYLNERPYPTDTLGEALFWTDADILQYLNIAQVHYNAVVNGLDESYNIAAPVYLCSTLVNNTLPIPDDCQKIKYMRVFTNAQDDLGYEVKPINIVEINRRTAFQPYRYYLQANDIKFTPDLASSMHSVQLYYLLRALPLVTTIPVPVTPPVSTTTCYLPVEIHENICIRAVVQGLLRDKQKVLADEWLTILRQKDLDVVNFLKPRDAQEANTVLPRMDWEMLTISNYGM